MAATSTPKIDLIARQIIKDFQDIEFLVGDNFHWSPAKNQIVYPSIANEDDLLQLLHEIGHATLGHRQYSADIVLLEMERQAWEQACEYASAYGLSLGMDEQLVQQSMDSYRQWLYRRSLCPNCQAVGVEQAHHNYSCLLCGQLWTVNEARTCQLRRHKK